MNVASRALSAAIIGPIRLYQRFISPMRPPTCRFYPSCSAYAVTALRVHGPFVGLWLAIRRLGRCHPWTPGGVDHVPPAGQWRSIAPPYDPREGDVHGSDPGPDTASDHLDDPDEGTASSSKATRSRPSGAGASSLSPARAWHPEGPSLRAPQTCDFVRRPSPAPGA